MTYDFILSQQEAQLVLVGLAELPLKTSGALYSKIQQAAIAQDQARAAPLADLEPAP
jgi:hypothetical protein